MTETPNKCALWWCRGDVYANGLCLKHYRNQQRHSGQVCLRGDAQALHAWTVRVQVLLMNITEKCMAPDESGQEFCRYCGATVHRPSCIVLTARGLLPDSAPRGGAHLRQNI